MYDLAEFGTGEYAKRYLDLVERVYAQDSAAHDYAATKAVIWNLHKAMIIKDEVYVAHLLTSEEKFLRDNHRYHVDEKRGDKIIYHHLNRPEFNIAGHDIRFKFSPKKWMLNTMKHFRWLRQAMPAWHAREREFRDWYVGIVEAYIRYALSEEAVNSGHPTPNAQRLTLNYDQWLQALRCVEEVRGYREIRYPKMEEAKRKVETLLSPSSRATAKHSVLV